MADQRSQQERWEASQRWLAKEIEKAWPQKKIALIDTIYSCLGVRRMIPVMIGCSMGQYVPEYAVAIARHDGVPEALRILDAARPEWAGAGASPSGAWGSARVDSTLWDQDLAAARRAVLALTERTK